VSHFVAFPHDGGAPHGRSGNILARQPPVTCCCSPLEWPSRVSSCGGREGGRAGGREYARERESERGERERERERKKRGRREKRGHQRIGCMQGVPCTSQRREIRTSRFTSIDTMSQTP